MKIKYNILYFFICFCNNFDYIFGFNKILNNKLYKKSLQFNYLKNKDILMKENRTIECISNNRKNNIYFTGNLNDETCFHLSEMLLMLEHEAMTNQEFPNHINLHIQSNGGSVMPTLAVVDQINNLNIPVNTIIRGYAASAATLLTVIGNERYMYENSFMMIHGLQFNDVTVSNIIDVQDLNFNVNLIMSKLKKIYLNNSDINTYILDNMFEHDIWIDADTALKYGLIDKII